MPDGCARSVSAERHAAEQISLENHSSRALHLTILVFYISGSFSFSPGFLSSTDLQILEFPGLAVGPSAAPCPAVGSPEPKVSENRLSEHQPLGSSAASGAGKIGASVGRLQGRVAWAAHAWFNAVLLLS